MIARTLGGSGRAISAVESLEYVLELGVLGVLCRLSVTLESWRRSVCKTRNSALCVWRSRMCVEEKEKKSPSTDSKAQYILY